MNETFSLLLKPASFDCNLRCRYCFYLPKEELFGPGVHRMDFGTLEAVTRSYLALPMKRHTFGWQGGEPTLMGVDFFREAVKLQKRYSVGGCRRIENALQTNGILLDDEYCKFLHENRFLVGISIDGPENLHDRFRRHADGRGSHREVMRGVELLKRHWVEFNALTLVSAANQDHPVEIYRYLKSLGIRFHQYIECVEFDGEGKRQPFALSPGKWGEFLCRLFDEWYRFDTRTVSIRLFDSILSRLVTGIPTICPMGGNCCNYLVVEHDGNVYPCDFHVFPELRLGNIHESGFAELRELPRYRSWGMIKDPHSEKCSSCRWLPLCMGDCPKNRTKAGSTLCEDWQLFYTHTIERFESLAAELSRQSPGTPGRNDPCPCGSGKKFKYCCGRK